MVGFIQKKTKIVRLKDDDFTAFCLSIEQEFEVLQKLVWENEITYKLASGLNKMRWVEAAEIVLKFKNDTVLITYSINTVTATLIVLMLGIGCIVFQIIENSQSFLSVLLITVSLAMILFLSFIAMQIFKFRINNLVNKIAFQNTNVNKEQEKWIADPAKCPACGHDILTKDKHCSDCGLRLY